MKRFFVEKKLNSARTFSYGFVMPAVSLLTRLSTVASGGVIVHPTPGKLVLCR